MAAEVTIFSDNDSLSAFVAGAAPLSHVYFIRNNSGCVKIGISTDVQSRLSSLETGAGERLELLRCIPGGRATEKWLHKRYGDRCVFREWFEYHEEMLSVVPPDEVPKIPKITRRRDIKLTLRERVKDVKYSMDILGIKGSCRLSMIVTVLNDEERSELEEIILNWAKVAP